MNTIAVSLFLLFVLVTLYITYWAAKQISNRDSFYTAGGNISGFQNGLAISGDFMSAASFLGISGLVFATGFDGLIYSIGFLVGWPIVLLLIAEPLKNLGKYTFADVASYRLQQKPIRTLSALALFALRKGKKASVFFSKFKKIPQILKNIDVKDKNIINKSEIKNSIKIAEKLIKGHGRILVRKSGTESKIRVMGESENVDLLEKCLNIIVKKIK